jgi:hypothetical protein
MVRAPLSPPRCGECESGLTSSSSVRAPAQGMKPARGEPLTCQPALLNLLDLLVDHPVQPAPDPLEIQSLGQRLPLLHGVQSGFHDVCRVEARREGTRRKFLEGRDELEHLDLADVVQVPIPEGV